MGNNMSTLFSPLEYKLLVDTFIECFKSDLKLIWVAARMFLGLLSKPTNVASSVIRAILITIEEKLCNIAGRVALPNEGSPSLFLRVIRTLRYSTALFLEGVGYAIEASINVDDNLPGDPNLNNLAALLVKSIPGAFPLDNVDPIELNDIIEDALPLRGLIQTETDFIYAQPIAHASPPQETRETDAFEATAVDEPPTTTPAEQNGEAHLIPDALRDLVTPQDDTMPRFTLTDVRELLRNLNKEKSGREDLLSFPGASVTDMASSIVTEVSLNAQFPINRQQKRNHEAAFLDNSQPDTLSSEHRSKPEGTRTDTYREGPTNVDDHIGGDELSQQRDRVVRSDEIVPLNVLDLDNLSTRLAPGQALLHSASNKTTYGYDRVTLDSASLASDDGNAGVLQGQRQDDTSDSAVYMQNIVHSFGSDRCCPCPERGVSTRACDDGGCIRDQLFFNLKGLEPDIRAKIYAHMLLLDASDIINMKLTSWWTYYEMTRFNFNSAGITKEWGSLHSLRLRGIKLLNVEPSIFEFSTYESYRFLQVWRRCRFFKPLKRIVFTIPTPSEGLIQSRRERRNEALKYIQNFFQSLSGSRSDACSFIAEVHLDLGCIASMDEVDALEIARTLEYTSSTRCKMISLSNRSGSEMPTNHFNVATIGITPQTHPSLRQLRVAGSIFFTPEVIPWIYANLLRESGVWGIAFRETGLQQGDLSGLLRSINLKWLKSFEVENMTLWDIWTILINHRSVERINTLSMSPDMDMDLQFQEEIQLCGLPALTSIQTIRGSGRQVAHLLPLINIQTASVNLKNLELLIPAKAEDSFDAGGTFDVLYHLAMNNIIVVNLSLQFPPSPSSPELAAFFAGSPEERPEKYIACQTIVVCVDACGKEHEDFAILFRWIARWLALFPILQHAILKVRGYHLIKSQTYKDLQLDMIGRTPQVDFEIKSVH